MVPGTRWLQEMPKQYQSVRPIQWSNRTMLKKEMVTP
jgi:hypothetical protein